MTIKDAIHRYRLFVRANRSVGTQSFYSFYFHKLETYLGDKDIEVFSTHDMTLFIQRLRQDHPMIKHITINKYIVTFKTIYQYGLAKPFPYKKLIEQKTHIPMLSPQDIQRVFTYYQSAHQSFTMKRNELLFHLLLDTGLRIHELLSIKKSNLYLEDRLILVEQTKSSVNRYVFFTETSYQLLLTFLHYFPQNNHVFIDEYTQNKLVVSSIETIVHRLKKTLHISKSLSPHKWRHTFATHYLTRGGSLESLRLLLGHAHLNTTQKYLHVSKETLSKEYRLIMEEKPKQ
jgi:site-specific recombinase XerD